MNDHIFFKNLKYLTTNKGFKIGEIEKAAGVSAGYIAKVRKDYDEPQVVLSVEKVLKIANFVNYSVETLCTTDLSKLNPTEDFLLDFFNNLLFETKKRNVLWIKGEINKFECYIAKSDNFEITITRSGLVRLFTGEEITYISEFIVEPTLGIINEIIDTIKFNEVLIPSTLREKMNKFLLSFKE